MQLQNKFNNEKWSFYHNLSGPNKKIEKKIIFGPLRSKLDLRGPKISKIYFF